MRILTVSDFYPPLVGGLERHVQSLGRELVQRGHVVSVATLEVEGASGTRSDEGVQVHHLRSASSRLLRRFYGSASRPFHPTVPDPPVVLALRRIITDFRPDIVHARGWMLYSLLAAISKETHAKVVVTLHDYSLVCPKKTYLRDGAICDGPAYGKCVTCAAEQYGGTKALALTTGLHASGRLHRRIDHVVAVSRAVADASRAEADRRRVPLSIIPSFIAEGAVVAGHSAPRPEFLPSEDGYLMYAGALDRHKGIATLLEAYVALDNPPPLLLFAPRSDASLVLPPGARLVHDAPHESIMASWLRCSIGLVPSLWPEPFGQVAVEAMAMGRPVIASDIGGLADVIEDERTGMLVPAGDSAQLALAIRSLLADRERANRMGQRGRERAPKFFVSTVASKIEALYQGLLDHPSAGHGV